MFGIAMEAIHKIMAQKTEHSWLKPIMMSVKPEDWEHEEQVENQLNRWIEDLAQRMFPGSELTYRMVRDALIPTLERKAIAQFLSKENQWADLIPEVTDAKEAARIAQMDVMASEEEAKQTEQLLQILDLGLMSPNEREVKEMTSPRQAGSR